MLDPLELELQVVMSHLLGVLESELRSFTKAESALNCQAILPSLSLERLGLPQTAQLGSIEMAPSLSPSTALSIKAG